MIEINLLRSLPKGKRNVRTRSTAKTDEHIRISRQYGQMYFDGPREYGYGGYKYDGRWIPVAKDIIKHFGLNKGDKVLDVGCGKGFLVKDLLSLGIDVYGIDISQYAIDHCEKEVVKRLEIGSADDLKFPDNSFKAVISKRGKSTTASGSDSGISAGSDWDSSAGFFSAAGCGASVSALEKVFNNSSATASCPSKSIDIFPYLFIASMIL